MDAERFFTDVVPASIRENVPAFLSAQARVTIAVGSDQVWTLRFGDEEEPLVRGSVDDAALRVEFTPEAFEAFTSGELDPEAAVADGAVRFEGDPALLIVVGAVLVPSYSPLSIRTGAPV